MDPIENFRGTVIPSVTRVVEDMLFLCVAAENAYARDGFLAPLPLRARIDFDGRLEGRAVLSASPKFARHAAAGILGRAPGEVTWDQGEEAVRELLNVCIGDLLFQIDPFKKAARIGIPKMVPFPALLWNTPLMNPVHVFPFISDIFDDPEAPVAFCFELSCGLPEDSVVKPGRNPTTKDLM